MTILLTGGAGYIGSHTAIELLESGYDVIVVDNLSNSTLDAVHNVEKIAGKPVTFYQEDVRDGAAMERIFAAHKVDAVIHFAGFKAVGESVSKPVAYYRNNVDCTLTLLETMAAHGVKKLIFSSSATVYGDGQPPYTEESPVGGCSNPYGRTKLMIEQILRDAAFADPAMQITLLRYFNPVGAHPSGLIGESPLGTPNNLMPRVIWAAKGIKELSVFGSDYPTPDGTCIRDYIHVMDLAAGHVAALKHMEAAMPAENAAEGQKSPERATKPAGVEVYNLGTGNGVSVLDLIQTFERVNGVPVPYRMDARRPGDLAVSYAVTAKAERELGWKAARTLADMCRDAWRWGSKH